MLLLFFLCAVVILKLAIVPCCSLVMNSIGFALPATNQAQPPSCDSESPRLSHTSPKCCCGRGAASASCTLMGRETLHTQRFPRRLRAEDTIQMPHVLPWFAYGRPCRIAKRYVCAAKSPAVLLGVFVAHLFRTLQIAKTLENVSSDRFSVCAFGRHK